MKRMVSVVVPCRNEAGFIGRCLDSLLENDHPQKEILVVDGESQDGTRDILQRYEREYPQLRLLNNTGIITSKALNKGIQEARGEYIMIAGAHSVFPKNYIRGLLDHLDKLEAAGVGGRMITRANASPAGHSIARVLSNPIGVGNAVFRLKYHKPVAVDTIPYGIYRRKVFRIAGSYDERLVRNQDIEFSKRVLRLVGKLYLIPAVSCDYHFKGKYRFLAGSSFRNGLWNILTIYITRKLSSISFRHLVPLLFLISLLILAALSVWLSPVFIWPLLFVATAYVVLITITAFRINQRSTSFWHILWSFVVLHFSYGWGSLLGLFHLGKLVKSR